MRMYSYALVLFLLSTVNSQGATDSSSSLLHYDLDIGFPTNNVYSSVQDKNGYVWFATDRGAVKYNGYTFKLFNTTNGLPSDDIWQLYPDKNGRVWVYSSAQEFGYIKNDVYKSSGAKLHGALPMPLYVVDKRDFFAFIAVGYSLDISNAHITFMREDFVGQFPLTKDGKNYANIKGITNDIYVTKDFDLYFCTGKGDLYKVPRFDIRRTVKLCNVERPVSLWSGFRFGITPEAEIYRYIPNTKTVTRIFISSCNSKTLDIKDIGASADESIYMFISWDNVPHDQKDLIITKKNIYFLNRDLSLFKRVRIDSIIPTLSQVAYRYVDRSGQTWYSTKGDGVWCNTQNPALFKDDVKSLSACKYVGLVNNTSSYWWDQELSMLYIVEKNKVVDTIALPRNFLVNNVTGNDTNLLLVLASGMSIYNKITGKFNDFKSFIPAALKDSIVEAEFINNKKTFRDRENFYILRFNGLIEYKITDSIISRNKIADDRYNNIYNDTFRNKIWLYNYTQVMLYDKKTGGKLLLKPEFLRLFGHKNIKKIISDKHGNIYILEGNRIAVYNSIFNREINLYRNFTLTDGTIEILNDKIIVAGRFGVAYATIKGPLQFSNFSVSPNTGFYKQLEELVTDKTGNVILKTSQGVKSFDIDQLIDGAYLKASNNYSVQLMIDWPFERPVYTGDTIQFDQVVERIRLNTINFNGKGDVRYRYLIKAKDPEWSNAISGEVFLADMEPGTYHRIDCVVEDDILRTYPVSFYVYRHPYWYQTSTWKTVIWITASVLLLALVLVTVLITRYYVAKKNEKRRAQTELELRAIHSQINPHFIFNTLSTALYFISKKRFDDAYIHVKKFSRLLRSYLKSSHDRYVLLGEEIHMLRNYIELQQTRFENKFDYKIEMDNKIPVDNIQIPSLLLQPLIENAINHGLFHKDGDGMLTISFLQGADNTELICIIEDNGVGRARAKEINEASSTKESYGTKLTNQLLEVFKEYEHMNIFMEYTDKKGPEAGTIVTLTLKNIKYVA